MSGVKRTCWLCSRGMRERCCLGRLWLRSPMERLMKRLIPTWLFCSRRRNRSSSVTILQWVWWRRGIVLISHTRFFIGCSCCRTSILLSGTAIWNQESCPPTVEIVACISRSRASSSHLFTYHFPHTIGTLTRKWESSYPIIANGRFVFQPLLAPHYTSFLVRADDPRPIKKDKMQLLRVVISIDNHQVLLREFTVSQLYHFSSGLVQKIHLIFRLPALCRGCGRRTRCGCYPSNRILCPSGPRVNAAMSYYSHDIYSKSIWYRLKPLNTCVQFFWTP